jgi:hypothetical protein
LNIEEFKSEIEKWPRDKRGRLMLSAEKYSQIAEVLRASGQRPSAFSLETGLNLSTVFKSLRGGRKGARPRIKRGVKEVAAFDQVKLVEPAKAPWVVLGPSGIQVTCASINQLTELWRALC